MGVFESSPALQAGIQAGDAIVTWDGNSVETREALTLLVAQTEIGTQVEAIVSRDGRELKLTVDVGRRPDLEVIDAQHG